MIKVRNINNIAIIMLFALLHFVVAVISRALDYYDDIPLTILTITMVIVVAMRNDASIEMMAIITLVATLLGYVIGSWLREPIYLLINDSAIAPAISTFLVTTALGLATNYITQVTRRFRKRGQNFALSPLNITITALSILILRMVYVAMDRTEIFTEGMLVDSILNIVGNSWALLTLLASNIVLAMRVTAMRKQSERARRISILILSISTIVIPLITSTIIHFDIPLLNDISTTGSEFIRIFLASLLLDLIIITGCCVITISLDSRRELREERELKHRSEYQYERLKQQINPHFLFNSLSILDYLVQEHETERASSFIHKLADMYRYMLKNDQNPLVKISEELDFTHKYLDLLKERFTEGMVFEIDLPEEYLERYIVPCALQLLVENATKHNIVSSDMPLAITITVDDGHIVVRNNLQLRTHGQPSTHLGLENIRRQYLDLTKRDISVEKTENEFIVKLPIV
ncbi:MAG: hypothetical protein E7146_04115 [Rikenellaceae bacterium]|nr:hypothetical protein [Rikenellaceae bacterium]